MEKFNFLNKNNLSKLPETTGIYCFKSKKDVLYIGKAINIKGRVKNHFQQPTYRDNLFINQVSRIGYIKTDSEIEALILEANFIKKHQPKYNVVWRDDKNYFFVGVTKEDFPRVFITHQKNSAVQGSKYKIINNKLAKIKSPLKASFIGPFVEGKALKQTLTDLRKVFPYRSYKIMPKKPCLWYQLNRCPGPCVLNSLLAQQIPNAALRIKQESQRNAKNLVKVLLGKRKQALGDLKREMKSLSQKQKFEEANKIKNQINSLERVMSHAKVFEKLEAQTGTKHRRIEAYDISNIQGTEATGSMVVFVDGRPDKSQYRKFKIRMAQKPNDVAMIKEVLQRRLRHKEWPYPDLILIDGGKPQLNAVTSTTDIEVIALAKKKNELYSKNKKKPVLAETLPRPTFNLLLQLRDEAHRFARTYHHKLRRKALLR
ncbi:MAG: GIY-YIG nuclease family protein [Candidatus Nealsonbacteria bacterium]